MDMKIALAIYNFAIATVEVEILILNFYKTSFNVALKGNFNCFNISKL